MGDRPKNRFGRFWVLGVAGFALAACGAEPAPSAELTRLEAVETAPNSAAEVVGEIAVSADAPTALPAQQDLDQPAIWPAPDVVFATPEEAAADFVAAVLISEGDPLLGEFRQGDARSGEIAVLFAGESGDVDPPQEQGLLFLRQIGPTDGWYVIAATSDGATIATPSALAGVPAGAVTVSGEGRGFEGTLAVSAFPPGDAAATFDLQIGAGGAFEELEPYSVELDLSGAADGGVVVILVRGDTGLGSDPGTFAAIPVLISSVPGETLPPTK
ncbi:MAG TPA: hypothetical protein VK853_08960 [Ilumatobacteraceae bacterium]|nr:hypothetical protein [Ilumatobacteraceae bacterium]